MLSVLALSLLAGAKPGDHCLVVFYCGVEALTPAELVDGKIRQEYEKRASRSTAPTTSYLNRTIIFLLQRFTTIRS
jgi:hypothetical protein